MAVFGREDADHGGEDVATPLRNVALEVGPPGQIELERRRHAFLGRDVDVLGDFERISVEGRYGRGGERLEAGLVLRLLPARDKRFAVGIAGEGHLAARGERNKVRCLAAGTGAGLTEGRDRDEHDTPYDSTQRIEAQAEFVDHSRRIVFDDEIRLFDHALE